MKKRKSIKQTYQESKRSSLVVYTVLRVLVIVCMVLQILIGNFENALLCLLSLLLLLVPFFIQKNFKITLPNTLEIIILLFIFSAEILGEIQNFYGIFPFWATMLHTINGFIAAAVGFSLINLLNKNSEKFNLSPVYLCLVAFCFSMTIGVLWEFFEFASDKVLSIDMQKDRVVDKISSVELDPEKNNNPIVIKDIGYTIIYNNEGKELAKISNGYLDIGINDTMKDLIVNFIGAVVFSIIGILYLRNRGKGKLAASLIPQVRSKQEEEHSSRDQ